MKRRGGSPKGGADCRRRHGHGDCRLNSCVGVADRGVDDVHGVGVGASR